MVFYISVPRNTGAYPSLTRKEHGVERISRFHGLYCQLRDSATRSYGSSTLELFIVIKWTPGIPDLRPVDGVDEFLKGNFVGLLPGNGLVKSQFGWHPLSPPKWFAS